MPKLTNEERANLHREQQNWIKAAVLVSVKALGKSAKGMALHLATRGVLSFVDRSVCLGGITRADDFHEALGFLVSRGILQIDNESGCEFIAQGVEIHPHIADKARHLAEISGVARESQLAALSKGETK